MFCPVCKYEFRRGFTHCNTCDVNLVEALPTENEPQAPAPAQLDEPTLLWRGSNAGTEFNEITRALDAAGIRYNREELDARLMLSAEYAQLEIWVPAAQRAEAEKWRDEVLASHSVVDAGASESGTAAAEPWPAEEEYGEEEGSAPGHFTTRLHPHDATSEIWSGQDANMASILKTCLAEIGVPCYVQDPDDGSETGADSVRGAPSEGAFALFVRPEDESRAKAIVRQVSGEGPGK